MTRCRPEVLTALVDGELDDAARERVHAHLAHCAGCRVEVEDQRRLKARLRLLAQPGAPLGLVARLHALPAPGGDPLLRPAPAAAAPRRVGVRPDDRRPPGRPLLHRRGALATAALAGGVAGLLLLGSPSAVRPAVDPGSPELLVDHASTTGASTTGSRPRQPVGDPAVAVLVPVGGSAR